MKPASTATTIPVMIVIRTGVPNVGWTVAERRRQQAVAAHGEEHPGLPEHAG